AKKYIVRGNHDGRFETWIRTIGTAIASLEEMTLDGLLYTKELGWEPICDEIIVNPRGDELYPDAQLYIIHGDSVRASAGASVRSVSESYGSVSAIVGHSHRMAMTARRTARGIMRSWEVGTLEQLNPEFVRFPDWAQSCMTGVISKDFFDFSTHLIDRGRVIINGELIEV